MEGFDSLGVDEVVKDKTAGEKTLDFLKTAAPGIITAATEAAAKKDDKKPGDMTKGFGGKGGSGGNWLTDPSVAGLPGYGILLIGGGLLTGLGFLVKRILTK